MGGQKLIVSGLSDDDLHDFAALVSAVGKVVAPPLQRTVDRSVSVRFAVNLVVQQYKSDPARLARALGFEVR